MAQSTSQAAAAGQTIEAYVAAQLDDARLGPIHWRVMALVTAGLFLDVMDFSILGALVPDLLKSGFISQPQVASIGSAMAAGLLIGAIGQGEFTDRFGRKAVYQFNLALFGLATIAAALAPSFLWLVVGRFIAGIGLGAEGPLCYAYVAEYSPRRIRGRMLAFMQFIGGAWPWPIGTLFALGFRDVIGWRGIWIVIGIAALVVFVLRFALPGSPRWLATHGRGQDALDLLQRMDLPTVPLASLRADAASDTRSDPFAVVFRNYPVRIAAAMVCFFTFFGIALGLGAWLPNILTARGLTITKSLTYTFGITLAFPCSSALMMYALEKFGRRPTAVAAFILAGVFAVGFASATSNTMVLVVGFVMIFFIQLAGNSSQTFISEVFPTNARASGFGLAQAAGRVGAIIIIPSILLLQHAYGLTTVFALLAVLLVIAAFAVTKVGPEARGLALDELAPPTA
jgi:MFS transporter, putative metabolite:H+ symporter